MVISEASSTPQNVKSITLQLITTGVRRGCYIDNPKDIVSTYIVLQVGSYLLHAWHMLQVSYLLHAWHMLILKCTIPTCHSVDRITCRCKS